MRKTRKRTITTEKREILIIRKLSRPSREAFCPQCDRIVLMLDPEEAGLMVRTSTRAIYRLIESALIHFQDTPNGSLRICLDSLAGTTIGESSHETVIKG